MNEIVSIVVTYNRKELLIECLEALKRSSVKTDILVVDNASTDGTQDAIKSYVDGSRIFYLNTEKNIGGAGGFNYGLKKAFNMGYKYFWLMDDDTIVREDSLNEILNAKNIIGENFGFLSSLAEWTDGALCKMNHHYISPKWNESKNMLKHGLAQIEIATFVSFFTKRDVLTEVGYPIKDFFIWGDDTEFSLRISKKFPCYLVSKSVVLHKMKDNQGSANFESFTDETRINRMFFAFRNGCYTKKTLGYKKTIKYLLTGLRILKRVWLGGNKYKIKKTAIIIKGYVTGLMFFKPVVERPETSN